MVADQFEILSERARQALAEGNAAQARQFYLQALAERPDSPDAHYGLATAFFLLQDLESAAFHFKEVTRIDPLRAGAYVNLGAVYNRLDQLDDAIKTLRRGIQLDPHRAEAYYNLGLAYRRQGQAELAVQAYREATHHNPRMADAHYNLANLLLELTRYHQAITHYKHALDVHPRFEKARVGLEQAEAALAQSEGPATPAGVGTAVRPAAATATDMLRTLDPQLDGAVLSALHRATIVSENYGRDFLKVLESEIEPAIKELSTVLLYPEKISGELSDRVERFETALNQLKGMERNLQLSIKKVREISDRLFTEPPGGAT
jgi:tetratricopeptide (TPR) repeat protein